MGPRVGRPNGRMAEPLKAISITEDMKNVAMQRSMALNMSQKEYLEALIKQEIKTKWMDDHIHPTESKK